MSQAPYAITRSNPRFPFFADAELNLEDGMCVPAQLSELSARGCYIDALQPVAVGTEMKLCICYGPNTCELKGKVIYEHAGGGMGVFGMGVVFRDIGVKQHHLIQDWLSQLARQRTSPDDDSDEPR